MLLTVLKLKRIFLSSKWKKFDVGKEQNLSVIRTDEIDNFSKKYVTFETDIRLLKAASWT